MIFDPDFANPIETSYNDGGLLRNPQHLTGKTDFQNAGGVRLHFIL
jgi:hypothetical protein